MLQRCSPVFLGTYEQWVAAPDMCIERAEVPESGMTALESRTEHCCPFADADYGWTGNAMRVIAFMQDSVPSYQLQVARRVALAQQLRLAAGLSCPAV